MALNRVIAQAPKNGNEQIKLNILTLVDSNGSLKIRVLDEDVVKNKLQDLSVVEKGQKRKLTEDEITKLVPNIKAQTEEFNKLVQGKKYEIIVPKNKTNIAPTELTSSPDDVKEDLVVKIGAPVMNIADGKPIVNYDFKNISLIKYIDPKGKKEKTGVFIPYTKNTTEGPKQAGAVFPSDVDAVFIDSNKKIFYLNPAINKALLENKENKPQPKNNPAQSGGIVA
jgi:hypothetical protein